MKLIALTGLHGSGKDTVADALPARKLAFADVLYREVAAAFGVTVDRLRDRVQKEIAVMRFQIENCHDNDFVNAFSSEFNPLAPRSPRQILQWWGDYRREQDLDYFVRRTASEIGLLQFGQQSAVLTDVRFPNEAAMVRQLGGQIWQVVRPGHEPPRTGHASETTGDEFAPDVVIVNDGSVPDLQQKALAAWEK